MMIISEKKNVLLMVSLLLLGKAHSIGHGRGTENEWTKEEGHGTGEGKENENFPRQMNMKTEMEEHFDQYKKSFSGIDDSKTELETGQGEEEIDQGNDEKDSYDNVRVKRQNPTSTNPSTTASTPSTTASTSTTIDPRNTTAAHPPGTAGAPVKICRSTAFYWVILGVFIVFILVFLIVSICFCYPSCFCHRHFVYRSDKTLDSKYRGRLAVFDPADDHANLYCPSCDSLRCKNLVYFVKNKPDPSAKKELQAAHFSMPDPNTPAKEPKVDPSDAKISRDNLMV